MVKLETLPEIRHTNISEVNVSNHKNGLPTGRGTSKNLKGHKYNGIFKNGLPHGGGLLNMNEDGEYEGSFRKGFAHGKGKLIHHSGTFKSIWSNGKIHMQDTEVKFKNGD